MNIEDTKNISETLKNIIISFAVIIGGSWTLYSFYTKYESEIAQLKVQGLQQKLIQRPIIEGDLEPFVSYNKKNSEWNIRAVLTLRNKGKQDSVIQFNPKVFSIAKANFEHGKISSYSHITNTHLKLISKTGNPFSSAAHITLLSNQEKKLEVIFKVKNAGVYIIQFQSKASERMLDIRIKSGIPTKNNASEVILFWKFVNIIKQPNK